METFLHTPSNLYTFIKKAHQREITELEIKNKEKQLELLENVIESYEEKGFEAVAAVLSKTYNQLYKEILILKLQKYELEKKLLQYELAVLLED